MNKLIKTLKDNKEARKALIIAVGVTAVTVTAAVVLTKMTDASNGALYDVLEEATDGTLTLAPAE